MSDLLGARGAPADAAYHELCAYTLALRDPEFMHQHVVDAHAAQHATAESKPIAVAFALYGLYLHLERGCTGRAVQLAHLRLARVKREWPRYALPERRTTAGARDVLAEPPGEARRDAIDRWASAVWQDWHASHEAVREFVTRELGDPM